MSFFSTGLKAARTVAGKAVATPGRRKALRSIVGDAFGYIPDFARNYGNKVKRVLKEANPNKVAAKIGHWSPETKRKALGYELGGGLALSAAGVGYEGHLLNKERKERHQAVKEFKASLEKQKKQLGIKSKSLGTKARKFNPVRRTKRGF